MLSSLPAYWFLIIMFPALAVYFILMYRFQGDRSKTVKIAAWFSALTLALYLLKFPPGIEGWFVGVIAVLTGWAFGRSYRFLGIL